MSERMSEEEFQRDGTTVNDTPRARRIYAEARRARESEEKLAAEVERLNKQCPCWCHSETQRADLRELLDAAEKERDEAVGSEAAAIRLSDGLVEQVEGLREGLSEAVEIMGEVYVAVHREGWEPGRTKGEAIDRLHAFLCATGHDPNKESSNG